MLQIAMADGGSSDDERAIGHCLGHRFVNFGGRQRGRGADCRTSVAERYVVRIDQPQVGESEVAHGPGGRANIERISHVYENDAQTGEFGGDRQAVAILRQELANHFQAPHILHKARRGGEICSKPLAA
jgi:hypothetical protein